MNNDEIATSEEFLRTIIEKLDTDILFECFAGMLVSSGKVDIESVHVIPYDNYSRSYKNDIVKTPELYEGEPAHYFEENESNLLMMYTSRSAILDYLPENFYIEPDNTNELFEEDGTKRSPKEIKKYREAVKERLRSAHLFFRPLEVEYNKVRINREVYEVSQLENFDNILEVFWSEFLIINDKWRRFVRTLHLIPNVLGDQKKIKALIEFVLETPVSLSSTIEEYCEISEAEHKTLTGDEMILGFNVILGNDLYDYAEVCVLKIENLSSTEFFNYFDETANDRKLLNEIIKYYFPLNVEVRLDFSIDVEKNSVDGEPAAVVLGYSSKLGE